MDSKKEIGLRIKKIRTDRSMKQEDFGVALEVNRSVISRLETGRQLIDQDLLGNLWDTFRVSPHWVITGEEEESVRDVERLKSELKMTKQMLSDVRSDRDSKAEIIRLMKAYYSDSDKKN